VTPAADRLAAIERRREDRLRAIRTRRSRHELSPFLELTNARYLLGAMHLIIAAELEAFEDGVRAGTCPHLMIQAPPRHGKSEIVSVKAPVWMLGRNEGMEVVCASYAADLAIQHSRRARECARSPEAISVFPSLAPTDLQLRRESRRGLGPAATLDRVEQWQTGNHGQYKAVGVGGPLTGHGFNVGIVDDPVKDAAEASSATTLDQRWDWYTSTFYTRMDARRGGVIVTHTPWSVDDISGRLLRQERERWRVVALPAIADAEEAARLIALGHTPFRSEGEALDPARWPLERLQRIKATLPARWWRALFDLRPVPTTGTMFQRPWFRERYRADPVDVAREADAVWITSDAARKAGVTNDFHSIQVWAVRGARLYLLDRICQRLEYPEYRDRMDGMVNKWSAVLTGVLVEDAANGSNYYQERKHTVVGIRLFNPTAAEWGKDKSKPARAIRFQSRAESGQIILPAADHPSCPWVEDYLDCVCAFPDGTHDDDVDSTAQLVLELSLDDSGPSGFDLFAS